MYSRNTRLSRFLSVVFLLAIILPSSFSSVEVLASQVEQGEQCMTEIVSDTETQVDGVSAVATYDENPAWTAAIPGATWIWSSYEVENPEIVETKTFTRQFTLTSGNITESVLTISADNSFKVSVNGAEVAADAGEFNFAQVDQKTYNISSNLVPGSNTLTFEVTNMTFEGATAQTNPAGLLYSLKVVQEGSCGGGNGGGTPTQDPTVSLTATPTTINQGETSTLSWTSSNADSCSSAWFDGMGTAGSTDVSPATTTDYVVSCVGNSKTVYATTTVTVNVPTPAPVCTIDIVSDTTNTVNGANAVATYKDNPRWTATIPGATWIWKTFFVENPTQDEYYTFLKTFNVEDVSKVKTASLVVAADNSYTVNINGTEVAADATEFNYFDEEKDTYDVKASLKTGENGIYFVVKNWGLPDVTAEGNPAGLLYKLSITLEGENCGGNGGPTNTPPVITLVGDNPLTHTVNTLFTDPGATATDAQDGDLTSQIIASSTVNASTTGSYIIEYSVTDSGGLSATTTRTVNVVDDNNGGGGSTTTPSITLTANPSTITSGATSTLSWTSTNTNYCTAAWTSATSTAGSMDVAPTSTTEYSISCGGTYGTTTATTTVTVNTDNGGGNGGGGNGGGSNGGGGGSSNIGGRRRDISNLLAPQVQGEVLGASSCAYLIDHLKMGWNNDPVEMLKLKSFLNIFEKESLPLDTNFDQATFDAVSRFQNKYFSEVLAPWGHTAPTGFVYITTKKKINEIYCNTVLSLTPAEAAEIAAFKSMLENGSFGSSFGSRSNVLNGLYDNGEIVVNLDDQDSKDVSTTSTSTADGSIVKNMAVSLFSIPEGLQNFFSNSRNVIFAIIALIILSVVARMFLYGGNDEDEMVSSMEEKNTKAALAGSEESSPVIILPGEKKEDKNS